MILVAAAFFGTVFESVGQPTINGYLLAGAVVGPGGLGMVNELVQVCVHAVRSVHADHALLHAMHAASSCRCTW